jgi:hypothetical protein
VAAAHRRGAVPTILFLASITGLLLMGSSFPSRPSISPSWESLSGEVAPVEGV